MTTAALPSVDWIHLTVGDRRIDLAPSPGIELRLVVEPVADDRAFGLLDAPRAPKLRVAVDLIPADARTVARCESEAARVAQELGAYASPLSALREFSLEAALGGEGVPYNRVTAPRLTLQPGPASILDEDQPEPGVRVFTATAHADDDGIKYLMRRVD